MISPFSPSKYKAFSLIISTTPFNSLSKPIGIYESLSIKVKYLDSSSIQTELFLQLLDDTIRIGALAVELVDETDTRNSVTLHLAVNGNGLTLNALTNRLQGEGHTTDTTEDEDGAIEDTEGSFDFDGEIDVSWSIDDVDVVVLPSTVGSSRLDGDALLSLEIHGVHLGADTILATNLEEEKKIVGQTIKIKNRKCTNKEERSQRREKEMEVNILRGFA